MSDDKTNPEPSRAQDRCGEALAWTSPRPWRCDSVSKRWVFDSNGTEVAECCLCEDAALIVEAVNLKARIDDETRHFHEVKPDDIRDPVICITPPIHETEALRMYREQHEAMLKDIIRFRRMIATMEDEHEQEVSQLRTDIEQIEYHEKHAIAECDKLRGERDRLRDLVRRLADTLQSIIDAAEGRGTGRLDEGLVREAREALGEEGQS